MKGVLIVALLGLLLWTNRDRVPLEYQFWKKPETLVVIQNSSDQDIHDVVVVIWANPQAVGTIPKGKSYELNMLRPRDATEVVIRFRYGTEVIERHAGTLNEATGYRLNVAVNYAGVITTQVGTPGQAIQHQLP